MLKKMMFLFTISFLTLPAAFADWTCALPNYSNNGQVDYSYIYSQQGHASVHYTSTLHDSFYKILPIASIEESDSAYALNLLGEDRFEFQIIVTNELVETPAGLNRLVFDGFRPQKSHLGILDKMSVMPVRMKLFCKEQNL